MKKISLIAFLFFGFVQVQQAQVSEDYRRLSAEAFALYEAGEYEKSGAKYGDAFAAWGGKGMVNDRYNAACSWALANMSDSAFVQLFKIAQKGNYTDLNHLQSDKDLESLYGDRRWPELVALVKANKDEAEKYLDKPLVRQLETIYEEDQKYRRQIDEIEKAHGWDSEEMRAHWKIINEKDSLNLIQVTAILDERGWLGPDVVGRQGNTTLFLVIQHADIETQEHYLPLMEEAVKKGDAQPSSLALLVDRVALGKDELQTYGSQVRRDSENETYYVLPLKDPDNVDARRAEMGLGPLQDYVGRWGITWDPEAYKKMLPTYIERQKQ